GAQVFFALTEKGYVVWDRDGGLRELQPRGLPAGGDRAGGLLGRDGSLRLASGHPEQYRCRLTLLISPSVRTSESTAAFTARATTWVPTSTGHCATTPEAFSDEQMLVHTDRAQPAYLVRR